MIGAVGIPMNTKIETVLLENFRRLLFDCALVGGCLTVWGYAFLVDVGGSGGSSGTLAVWLAILLLTIGCFALRGSHFTFAVALWAVVLCGCLYGIPKAASWAQFGFMATLFVTMLLIHPLVVLPFAISGTVTLVVLPHPVGAQSVVLLWMGFGAGGMLNFALRRTLAISGEYQRYAGHQMQAAQEHRGQLAQLTKALREAKQDLEKANIQLAVLQAATEDARRAKAQFAAMVSHEIRTPINLIVGFSEVLLGSSDPASQATRTAIQTIARNSKHLQGLINDVLDMSQLDARQMGLTRAPTDPAQVAKEAVDLIVEAVAAKGLRLEFDAERNLPALYLDRLRIRQVILNLLGNAIRFTDSGCITVAVARAGPLITIRVSDTGIGIPPDKLDRVFEEFHQLEGSLARRYSGTGLGLTLSKRFIELHGGRLFAESEGIPGKGSAFTAELPLAPTPVSDALIPAVQRPQAAPGRYFVLLESDPAVRRLFERHTQSARVATTPDPAEAARLMTTIHPGAVVADAGANLALLLAANTQLNGAIPIITCTLPSGRRIMQRNGIADYLVKPVTREELQAALVRLPRTPEHILVVDDDWDIVRLYTEQLEGMGYRVRRAYSGAEALEFMRRRAPDVVILDLLMPEMSGLDVVAAMKADPALARVPVVIASAAGASEAVESIQPGLLTVTKAEGFQPVELVRCIETLVEALTPAGVPAPG